MSVYIKCVLLVSCDDVDHYGKNKAAVSVGPTNTAIVVELILN